MAQYQQNNHVLTHQARQEIKNRLSQKKWLSDFAKGDYREINAIEKSLYDRECLYHTVAYDKDALEEGMILPYLFMDFTYSSRRLITGAKWGRKITCPKCDGYELVRCYECDNDDEECEYCEGEKEYACTECEMDGFVADESDVIFTDFCNNHRHIIVDDYTMQLPL